MLLIPALLLGAGAPLLVRPVGWVHPLLLGLFGGPFAGFVWAEAVVALRGERGDGDAFGRLERATRHPGWWVAVGLGLAGMVAWAPTQPLSAAAVGWPSLVALGFAAGLRLASAPAAKP